MSGRYPVDVIDEHGPRTVYLTAREIWSNPTLLAQFEYASRKAMRDMILDAERRGLDNIPRLEAKIARDCRAAGECDVVIEGT